MRFSTFCVGRLAPPDSCSCFFFGRPPQDRSALWRSSVCGLANPGLAVPTKKDWGHECWSAMGGNNYTAAQTSGK
eukprot:3633294-Alexandrium_andersonii.AAC.1